jgi:exosortase A-associated hydrolase 2
MLAAPSHPPAHAFFLDAQPGRRYCLYHRPRGTPRGAILLAPAFAEEMNKSRRMCALQARCLADDGYGVLQIDVYGCGDSDGDFGDARWEIWKADLALALAWLRRECAAPVWLWGLRLGALLALDAARDAGQLGGLLLWQPVTNGAAYLTQFLRLRLAADMLAGGARDGGTDRLRRELAGGAGLEIAGYLLAPQLAAAIDALDIARLAPPSCPVHWFEVQSQPGQALPPGRARLVQQRAQAGWKIRNHIVEGAPFWSTQEIAEAPALLEATLAALQSEAL